VCAQSRPVSLIVMDDSSNLALELTHIDSSVKQEVMAGQYHVCSHSGVLKI